MLLDAEPSANFSSPPSFLKKLSPQLLEPDTKQLSDPPLTALPQRLPTHADSSSGCAQTDSGVGNTAHSPSPSPLDLSYSYREYVAPSFATVANGRDSGPSALSHTSPVADVSPFVYQASKPAAKSGKEPKKGDDVGIPLDRDGQSYMRHPSLDIAVSIADAMETSHLQPELETQLLLEDNPQNSSSQPRNSPHANLLGVESHNTGPSQSFALYSSSTSSRSLLDSRPSASREVEPAKSPLECRTHRKMHCSCQDRQPCVDLVDPNLAPIKESLRTEFHPGVWAHGITSDPGFPWQPASSDSDGQHGRSDSPPSFRSKSHNLSTEPSTSGASVSKRKAIPKVARYNDDLGEIEESPFANDNIMTSSSVPSESKIKSYFFGNREKLQKEERKKSNEKTKGHSRSHSMEYVNKKVPPLPPGMLQQHKAHIDFQDSLTMKHGSSQLSIESVQSDSKTDEDRPNTLSVDQHASSGSSEEKKSSTRNGKRFGRFSVNLRRSSKKTPSVTPTKVQRPPSPVIPYRDEDPTYLHNNFTLYLDMEVFDVDRKEHFKLAFKV